MNGWMQTMLLAAFATGLLGGVHCAAMCGSIVGLTCSRQSGGGFSLAYNAGRVLSYVLAGGIAGAFGQAGVALRGGALAQHLLMFLMGATLIVVALGVAGVGPVMRGIERAGSALWRQIQPYSSYFLPVTRRRQAFGLGMLWGWLPCGMVYAVLLMAFASGSAAEGALLLGAFGLGTLPNLLILGSAAQRAPRWLKGSAKVRLAASLLIAGVGVYGMLHALQPMALDPDSALCRLVPGLADWLRN